MRHFILLPFLALVLLPSKINAEEPADSISVELNEIVVQADAERTSPTSVIYTPDSRQKQSATSAIDLLAKMGIPQLTVDIMGTSATTVSGQPITYFIDYLPASEDQLSGMRTKDVKRVEYLEYPSDPRFHGAANVINYIMMQYEYGGYTKLTDSAWITTGLDANYFNAYSKLSYRKMTYDLYMGESYTHNHHNGSVNEETIRLRNNDGEWYDLSRTNKITDSFLLYNNIPVGFRATYATERMQIQNRVKFSFTDNPFSNSSGTLEITPGGGNDYSFSNVSSQVSRYAGWDASYFFSLPKSWSLSIYPQFEYTSTNQNSIYSSSLLENGNVVNNDAKDRSYGVSVYSYVGKMFSPKHQLFLHLKEQLSHNRVRYVHSGADNDFDSNLGIFGVGYTFSLPMIRVRAEGGAVCNYSLTNDKNYFTINPSVSLTANYAPNNKNSVAFSMSYSTYAPDSYLKTPNLIRLDEFLYAVGNPDVKPYNNLYTNLNWSWIPKSFFSGSINAAYNIARNRFMPIYESYDDGRGVLRSYANNGNSSMFVLGANFTFRLFDRSLQIQAGPTYMYAENTGIYPVSKSNFRGTVQASYFLKGFYASAAYYSPYRYLSKEGVYHRHKTPEYIIELGWSNSDWNVRALFKNFFESTWIEGSSIYETPFYSTLSDQYGINRHRQVSLHVTYTFGYGRRIDRGNEMGGGSGGSNAILK